MAESFDNIPHCPKSGTNGARFALQFDGWGHLQFHRSRLQHK